MHLIRDLRDDDIDAMYDGILREFELKIKNWRTDVKLGGKNIKVANVQQASFLAYYDEIRVDLKSLLNYYEMRVKQVRAESLQAIYKNSKYDYSSTEKDKIIDTDPKYIKYKRIYLEVDEMYNMLSSISEQFKNRAYTINNQVKILVASLEDITLTDD
jgi:hypothetical protein